MTVKRKERGGGGGVETTRVQGYCSFVMMVTGGSGW